MNRCQFCNHAHLCDDCHTVFYDDHDPIESAIQRTFIGSGGDVDLDSMSFGPEISFQVQDWGSDSEGREHTGNRVEFG
jgi:hypothetical protein